MKHVTIINTNRCVHGRCRKTVIKIANNNTSQCFHCDVQQHSSLCTNVGTLVCRPLLMKYYHIYLQYAAIIWRLVGEKEKKKHFLANIRKMSSYISIIKEWQNAHGFLIRIYGDHSFPRRSFPIDFSPLSLLLPGLFPARSFHRWVFYPPVFSPLGFFPTGISSVIFY